MKAYWWITGILFFVAALPVLCFGLGLLLNILTGCDIRDEGGESHGDCPDWQATLVYSLTMMMWLAMVSIPIFGSIAVTMLIIGILWEVYKRMQ